MIKTRTKIINYYSAFRDGFKFIWEALHKSSSCTAIVIHGVPGVGKSTLCHLLSLALAVKYGTCVKLILSDDMKSSMREHFVDGVMVNNKFVVLDQVDLGKLQLLNVIGTREDTDHGPIVIFTSGHYPPSARKEVQSVCVSFDTIHMTLMDHEVPICFPKMSESICKAATAYSHMYSHLKVCLDENILQCMFPQSENVVNMYLRHPDCSRQIRNMYNHLLIKADDDIPDNVKALAVDNILLSNLGSILAQIPGKDEFNVGKNSVFHLVEICNKDKTNINEAGFQKYNLTDGYCYYFPDYKPMRDFLHSYKSSAANDQYIAAAASFSNLFMEKNLGGAVGEQFELAISWLCKADQVGISPNSTRIISLKAADEVLSAEDLQSLKQLNILNNTSESGFIYVSFPRNTAGFDSAAVCVVDGKCTTLDLFQMTVNPKGRDKEKKEQMSKQLKWAMDNFKKSTVTAYYITPFHSNCNEFHGIPTPGSTTKQSLKVRTLKFPRFRRTYFIT